MGAVDTLIVWENLAIHRVVVRNNSTGTTNTLYLSEEQCLDATFFKDPATGIDLENESQIIQNVYTEYKNNGNNFDPTTNPELQEKLENSDVAKYLLKKLNIVK